MLDKRLLEMVPETPDGFRKIVKQTVDDQLAIERNKVFGFLPVARVVMAATIAIAILICFPTTRGGIIRAAEYVKNIFYSSKGDEVVVENGKNAENEWYEVSVTENGDNDYFEIEDGRIYFVLNDIKEDITDQCSNDTWFRYKNIKEDGDWSVILIGGTPDNCGWVELLFDKNGTYYTNIMNVPMNSEWVDPAMDAEGVPTGNPEYDQEFLQD